MANFLSQEGLSRLVANIKTYVGEHSCENSITAVSLDGVPQTITDKTCYLNLDSYAKKSDVISVMRYKGSVSTYGNLPTSDMVIGDTYNVLDTGMNYAWDGTSWDSISSTVDLSNYYTKGEVDSKTSVASYSTDTHRFSTGLVSGADMNTYASYVENVAQPTEITTAFIDSLF